MLQLRDTIIAISTPPGLGGIGVVRLSGPMSRSVAIELIRFRPGVELLPRMATVAEFVDSGGLPIDQVIVVWFAAPKSYTGEDVVEISCHGSPVVLSHCVERALALGARLAEPGEFTLRAYMNGRLDLPQAEAVRDLIQATTLHQARVAARQLEGGVSRVIAPIKRQLTDLMALLEAGIDFADDDVSVASDSEILRRLDALIAGLNPLIGSFRYGKLVHDGVTLAIVGRPNVGKSSLFNALLQQERAIVTEVAGTTRDTVAERMSIDGIPVRLMDTAGIRDSLDIVEKIGIARSRQAMADCDLTLVVVNLSEPFTEQDQALLDLAADMGERVVVGNKADLPVQAGHPETALRVSAKTGFGLAQLHLEISHKLSGDNSLSATVITSLRHEQLLRSCREYLQQAVGAVRDRAPHEALMIVLRDALSPIDELTGATSVDDILGKIFSTFCIGK